MLSERCGLHSQILIHIRVQKRPWRPIGSPFSCGDIEVDVFPNLKSVHFLMGTRPIQSLWLTIMALWSLRRSDMNNWMHALAQSVNPQCILYLTILQRVSCSSFHYTFYTAYPVLKDDRFSTETPHCHVQGRDSSGRQPRRRLWLDSGIRGHRPHPYVWKDET